MQFMIYSAHGGARSIPKSLVGRARNLTDTKEIARRTVANTIWIIDIDTIEELNKLLTHYSPDGATIFPAGAIHSLLPAIALDDSSNPAILVTESTAEEPTDQDPWIPPSASTN